MECFVINRGFKDLNPIVMGMEQCDPKINYAPTVRKYVLLHYVSSGKGTYHVGDKDYPVKKGEVFRILPGEYVHYRPDENDPWFYHWIGFDGSLSEKFSSLPPVFPITENTAGCFMTEGPDTTALEYRIAAKLFRLYAELFGSSQNLHYVQKVRNYIDASFMKSIKICEIAKEMNIDRSYLARLFRKETGKSMQEYLISVRMAEATRCLQNGLPVASAAEHCGYGDAFQFSKIFKSFFGVSPSEWKKENTRII